MNNIAKMIAIAKNFGGGSGGTGGTTVQSDWNQNDPNAADHVKGRTHYDNKYVVGLDITKDYFGVDVLGFRGENSSNIVGISSDWIKISDLTPSLDELLSTGKRKGSNSDEFFDVVSENYGIHRNTEDYYSLGTLGVRSPYSTLFVVLRAGASCNLGPETNAQGGINTYGAYVTTAPSAGIYVARSFSVSMGEYTLFEHLEWGNTVPLDEKYIPSTIARTADVPTDDHINALIDAKVGSPTVILPETAMVNDYEGVSWITATVPLKKPEIGKQYDVSCNGVAYTMQCVAPEGVVDAEIAENFESFLIGGNSPFRVGFPQKVFAEETGVHVFLEINSNDWAQSSLTISIVQKASDESSRGGVLMVNAKIGTIDTSSMSAPCELDMTYSAIKDALAGGQYVVCKVNALGSYSYMPVVQESEDGAIGFMLNSGASVAMITYESNNNATFMLQMITPPT